MKSVFGLNIGWAFVVVVSLIVVTLSIGGCGNIADPDRRVIAEFDGEVMRRSDLKKIIREMDDADRPLIQSRDDLVETLNQHINEKIKGDIAKNLRLEKKLKVPREQARAIYFTKNPEFVNVERITDPSVMNISQGELVALQAEMEFGIDDELEILFREAALEYYVQEYIESGDAKIDDEEFLAEYDRQRKSLMTFEYVDFIAIRFPNAQGAQQEAVKVRSQLDSGVPFETVLQVYLNVNPDIAFRASFENNPSKSRFERFWYSVTGCSKGDIIGPVFLPSYEQRGRGPDGKEFAQNQPDAWVVLEVQERRAPREKTLEEAKMELAMPIITGKVMDRLRDDYGVVVYPELLWRPEGYGDQFKSSIIRTKSQ